MADTSGKPVFQEYYVPWLTLFPKQKGTPLVATGFSNTEADLMLYISVDEEPDKLELRFDDTLFDINIKELTPKTVTTGTPHKVQIKIKCLKEFDTDKEIVVLTIKNKVDGTKDEFLAGKLKVSANKIRYKSKIVIVNVSTDIGNGLKTGNPTGRENELRKYLRQALIEPEFETLPLDLSLDIAPDNEKTKFNTIHAINDPAQGKWIIKWGSDPMLHTDLNALFNKTYNIGGKDYSKHIKVYFIDEYAKSTAGHTLFGSGALSTKSVTMFPVGFNDSTFAHETLHALGLEHSFDDLSEHTFEQDKTDNIMDYSDVNPFAPIPVIQLWKWQYGTIWTNAEPE